MIKLIVYNKTNSQTVCLLTHLPLSKNRSKLKWLTKGDLSWASQQRFLESVLTHDHSS